MDLQPFNRHILIKRRETDEEEDSGVLLPDGYTSGRGPEFVVAEIIDIADDTPGHDLCCGDSIIVRNSMIEELVILGKVFHVVLANHVMGKLVE